MLAVQRQVVEELVHQQPGQEADIGAPALQNGGRGRRAVQGLLVLALDEAAHVLEDDVAARALGQTMGDLLADDLVGVFAEPLGLRVGDLDDLHRDPFLVEEQPTVLGIGSVLGADTAFVGAHLAPRRFGTGRWGKPFPEAHLPGWGLDVAALGLLPEQLALEPRQLVFELGNALLVAGTLGGPVRGRFRSLGGVHGHGAILPDSFDGD